MAYFQVDINVTTPTPPHGTPKCTPYNPCVFKVTWTLLPPPHPTPPQPHPNHTPNDPYAYSSAMHTIQSMCVQVDMNVITPTPPQMTHICIFYCGFLHACMVLLMANLRYNATKGWWGYKTHRLIHQNASTTKSSIPQDQTLRFIWSIPWYPVETTWNTLMVFSTQDAMVSM